VPRQRRTAPAGSGLYTLWIPAGTAGTVTVTPRRSGGYLATGGAAGTTSGSYSRPSVSFVPSAGQAYSGVNFVSCRPIPWVLTAHRRHSPGSTVFYAHAFVAGSGGQVTFSLAGSATPSAPAWTQVLYQDSNCNGVLDSGEPADGRLAQRQRRNRSCV